MRKTLTIIMISLSLMGIVLSMSCTKNDGPVYPPDANLKTTLQNIVNTEKDKFVAFDPLFTGALYLEAITAKSELFVSSDKQAVKHIRFRAASTTKTFTAAGIILLYQRGLLDINDTLNALMPGTSTPYLPDNPAYNIPFKSQITIGNLLTHRAGVWDLVNLDIPDTITANVPYKGENYMDYMLALDPNYTFTFDTLHSVISKCGLYLFPPGSAYYYSNQGYTLLGKIIERVSGKTYQQFMLDEFVIPLKLQNTTFPDDGNEQGLPVPFATGNWIYGGSLHDMTVVNVSQYVAEGNLITSPYDLCRFIRFLLRGEAGIDLFYIKWYMMDCIPTGHGNNNYGMGLDYRIPLGYGHDGDMEGYHTTMIYDPISDIAFVVFCNYYNWDSVENFAQTKIACFSIIIEAKQALMN